MPPQDTNTPTPMGEPTPSPEMPATPAPQSFEPTPPAPDPMPAPVGEPTPPAPPSPTPVEQPVPGQPVPPAPQPAPAKSGFPKWLLFVIIGIVSLFVLIIVMVLVILKAASSSTAAPAAVGDKLLSSIQADDSNAVYALASDSFKTATSQSDTKSLVDGIAPDLKGTSTITGRKVETSNGKSLASIVYKVNSTSGDSAYLRVVLEKSGSDWKVVNFRTSKTALDATIE